MLGIFPVFSPKFCCRSEVDPNPSKAPLLESLKIKSSFLASHFLGVWKYATMWWKTSSLGGGKPELALQAIIMSSGISFPSLLDIEKGNDRENLGEAFRSKLNFGHILIQTNQNYPPRLRSQHVFLIVFGNSIWLQSSPHSGEIHHPCKLTLTETWTCPWTHCGGWPGAFGEFSHLGMMLKQYK